MIQEATAASMYRRYADFDGQLLRPSTVQPQSRPTQPRTTGTLNEKSTCSPGMHGSFESVV